MINGFNSKQVNRYIDIEMVWKLMVSVCMYHYVNSKDFRSLTALDIHSFCIELLYLIIYIYSEHWQKVHEYMLYLK